MLRPHCFCRKGITVQCRAWEMLPLSLKGICMGRLHSRTYMSKEGCLRRNICQQNNHKNKTIGITLNSIVSNHNGHLMLPRILEYIVISLSHYPLQISCILRPLALLSDSPDVIIFLMKNPNAFISSSSNL